MSKGKRDAIVRVLVIMMVGALGALTSAEAWAQGAKKTTTRATTKTVKKEGSLNKLRVNEAEENRPDTKSVRVNEAQENRPDLKKPATRDDIARTLRARLTGVKGFVPSKMDDDARLSGTIDSLVIVAQIRATARELGVTLPRDAFKLKDAQSINAIADAMARTRRD
jgi:acyl carrier protein